MATSLRCSPHREVLPSYSCGVWWERLGTVDTKAALPSTLPNLSIVNASASWGALRAGGRVGHFTRVPRASRQRHLHDRRGEALESTRLGLLHSGCNLSPRQLLPRATVRLADSGLAFQERSEGTRLHVVCLLLALDGGEVLRVRVRDGVQRQPEE